MAYFYGNNQKKTKGGYFYGGDTSDKTSEILNRVKNYETRFAAIGATPPAPKKETNLLLQALDILDRPRSAVVSALAGEGFMEGLTGKTQVNVADLLEGKIENPYLRAGLGFVGDILLDPLTYLTLGTAGVAKGVGTGVARAVGKELAEQGGKRTFLKFAGIPLADVTGAVSAGKKAVEATKLPELVGPVFSTRYIRRGVTSAEELPDVQKALELTMGTQRAIKGRQQEALSQLQKRFRETGLPEEVWSEASAIREAPTLLARRQGLEEIPTADTGEMIRAAYKLGMKPSRKGIEAAKIIKQVGQETTAKDILAGVEFAEVPNYIRHLYKDPPEKVQAVLSAWMKKQINMPGKKAGFQKTRNIPTIAEAKEMGLTPIEDARILTAVREMEGIRQRSIEQMYKGLHQLGENVVRDADKAPGGWKTFPAIKQLQGKAVHPEVARFLERFNSTVNTDEGMRTMLSVMNTVQNFWKNLVTAPNPAFHIRNALGNVWNNFLGGVVNPDVYRLAAIVQRGGNEIITIGGKEYTANQLRTLFREHGLEGFGFFGGESPKSMIKEATETFGKQGIRPIELLRKHVGDPLETNAKMAHFIDKLNKGYSPEQAAESVRKYLFDYADITEAEKKIRAWVPFYTFARKNIVLQLENLVTNPGKMTAINKLAESTKSSMGTQEDDMPDWMKSELAIPIGNDQYLMLGLPIAQLNMFGGGETMRNLLGMLSPFAKVPIETAMNQQIFSGAPLEKYPGARSRFGNVELPAKVAYGLSQFGAVPRAAADILGSLTEQQTKEGTIPSAPLQLPVISSLVRRVNPERERALRALRREEELADYRKYLEEVMGIEVPEMKDITKKKGRGYFY